MTSRPLTVGTALAAVLAGLLVTAPAARAAAPYGVHATETAQRNGIRTVVTGRAPSGARVVLQDRDDKHERWATEAGGRAVEGRFRVASVDLGTSRRVCVVPPGSARKQCTAVPKPTVHRRPGKVTLTRTVPQLVEDETSGVVAQGRLTWTYDGKPLVVRYLDPATGTWVKADPHLLTVAVQLKDHTFTVSLDEQYADQFGTPKLPSKQGLRLRVDVPGDRYVRSASARWTVDSYTRRSLATLPVASGTRDTATIAYDFFGGVFVTSEAVAPGGAGPSDSVTLTVPAGCGRVEAGVSQDITTSHDAPADSFTASVARNGVTAWSYDSTATAAAKTFSVDVAGGDALTLTASYDHTDASDRPWFVTSTPGYVLAQRMPTIFCAAP